MTADGHNLLTTYKCCLHLSERNLLQVYDGRLAFSQSIVESRARHPTRHMAQERNGVDGVRLGREVRCAAQSILCLRNEFAVFISVGVETVKNLHTRSREDTVALTLFVHACR